VPASDRDRIENLLAHYCELYDDGDFAGYAALFAGARVVGPTATLTGADEVQAYHEENCLLYDGSPRTRHVTTNVHIEVDEAARTARARSYVTVLQATDDFPLQAIFVGAYRDQLAEIDGEWRFVEREAVPFLVGDLSRHAKVYLPPTVRGTLPAESTPL
jgi:3-phenylpropionate/cinnamic acid dioxygenase small subunit